MKEQMTSFQSCLKAPTADSLKKEIQNHKIIEKMSLINQLPIKQKNNSRFFQ